MKLDVRARDLELPSSVRARIEKRVRLVVGHAVSGLDAVLLTVEPAPEPSRVICRLALRCDDGERVSLAESSSDPIEAIDLALWRLEHWLRRRALR